MDNLNSLIISVTERLTRSNRSLTPHAAAHRLTFGTMVPPSGHNKISRYSTPFVESPPPHECSSCSCCSALGRGDAHEGSDWDFGYQSTAEIDVPGLLAAIVETIRSDRVDLVDLARASGLLRYRAARDGVVVFEARPRLGESFSLEAADFWCDAGPLLQQGYAAVLADPNR